MSVPKLYDAIVIGTGAGGGMAIKTLCEAGLKVCAINAGRRLDPNKDFRHHRKPWDMKFRGFGDPAKRAESYGYMDNEWVEGVWEHEIPFTTAPGTQWMWPRCFAVGGKTNFWGRSCRAHGRHRLSRGVALGRGYDRLAARVPGNRAVLQPRRTHDRRREHRPEPAEQSRRRVSARLQFPLSRSHPAARGPEDRRAVSARPDRTADEESRRKSGLSLLWRVHEGCDTGSFFSTPWRFLPRAEATNNLELRTNALAKNILVDGNGLASGVAYIDRKTGEEVEVRSRVVVVAALMPRVRPHHAELEVAASGRTASRTRAASRAAISATTCTASRPKDICRNCWDSRVFPTTSATSQVVWMPRWQNLENPHEEKFVRTATRSIPRADAGSSRGIHVTSRASARRTSARSSGTIRRRSSFYCPGPVAPSADELPGPRSRGEGRVRHSGRARPFPVGRRTSC